MKNLLIYEIGLFIFFAIFSLSCSIKSKIKKRIEFVQIPTYTYFNSINNHKSEGYIIRNYSKSLVVSKMIDSFVCERFLLAYNKENDFTIIFYKESKFTNLEKLKSNERIIDRYSGINDKVFKYKIKNQYDTIVFKQVFLGDVLKEIIYMKCE